MENLFNALMAKSNPAGANPYPQGQPPMRPQPMPPQQPMPQQQQPMPQQQQPMPPQPMPPQPMPQQPMPPMPQQQPPMPQGGGSAEQALMEALMGSGQRSPEVLKALIDRQQGRGDAEYDRLKTSHIDGAGRALEATLRGLAANKSREQSDAKLEDLFGQYDEAQVSKAAHAAAIARAKMLEQREYDEAQALAQFKREQAAGDADFYRENPWLRPGAGGGSGGGAKSSVYGDDYVDTRHGGLGVEGAQRLPEEGRSFHGVYSPKEASERTDKLRDDFTKATEDFKGINTMFGTILAASGGGATNDAALVGLLNKIIDPRSAVTDGERAAFASLGGLLQKGEAWKQALLTGELTDEMRGQIVDFARDAYSKQMEEFDKTRQAYAKIAGSEADRGVRIEDVVGGVLATNREKLSQPPADIVGKLAPEQIKMWNQLPDELKQQAIEQIRTTGRIQ